MFIFGMLLGSIITVGLLFFYINKLEVGALHVVKDKFDGETYLFLKLEKETGQLSDMKTVLLRVKCTQN